MITAEELRAVLGADAALQARIDSIHAACSARIVGMRVARPTGSKHESLMLLYAAWLYQSGAQSRSVFPADGEGPPINVSRAFLLSGAQGLLSSWRRPRAGACR